MHPQLEILLELQDLKAQLRELDAEEEETSQEIEREVFQVVPEDAATKLESKIEQMEKALDPDIASRYKLVSGRRPRAVVPVINEICYGCFMAMPTAVVHSNDEVRWCENCGSFVYYVD